jgi:hypothetical protein
MGFGDVDMTFMCGICACNGKTRFLLDETKWWRDEVLSIVGVRLSVG